jgi:predicted dehydrogenase
MKNFFDAAHEPLVMQYRVNAGYLPPEHWVHDPEQGGGRIVGEVCHFIDFMTFLVDAIPQRVLAYGLPDNGRYKEDNVVITIEFPDGSLGTIAYLANGDRGLPKERVEVFGGGRVAVLDDFRRLEMYSGGRRRIRRAWFRQDKGHRAEWIAFVAAVASGGAPPIPYEQLFAVTTTSFAAVESLRSGEPITIEPLTVG